MKISDLSYLRELLLQMKINQGFLGHLFEMLDVSCPLSGTMRL